MKPATSSPKFFQAATFAALAVAAIFGLSVPTAWAGFIVNLQQVGTDVVAIGSGTIDTTDLNFIIQASSDAHMQPTIGLIYLATGVFNEYGGLSGPSSFGGGGGFSTASSSSGDIVGIVGAGNEINLPVSYVSGSALSDTSTYANATFSSLGVTPGTYEWTWGTGEHQDFFELVIGTVPDQGSTLLLLTLPMLGLVALRRRLAY